MKVEIRVFRHLTPCGPADSYKYSPRLPLIAIRGLSGWRIKVHDYKLTVTNDDLGNKFVVSFIEESLIQT